MSKQEILELLKDEEIRQMLREIIKTTEIEVRIDDAPITKSSVPRATD